MTDAFNERFRSGAVSVPAVILATADEVADKPGDDNSRKELPDDCFQLTECSRPWRLRSYVP
jgi:hypothetical protein